MLLGLSAKLDRTQEFAEMMRGKERSCLTTILGDIDQESLRKLMSEKDWREILLLNYPQLQSLINANKKVDLAEILS